MKQYNANNIYNVALIGHGSSGKTTLVEALLYANKATDRLGKISEGNTVSDFDPEEVKRKISINLSLAPFEYQDAKFNLLDAPGLFDFEGGMREAMRAAESVLLTVSGKSGVTVGAKKYYRYAKKLGKASMIFVGKLDRENSDFYKVHEQLKTAFGPSVCPLVVPFGKDGNIECYLNLLEMKAYAYQNGQKTEVPVPETHRVDGLITAISEAVAETDDELFEKYFSGEAFTNAELVRGIRKGVKDGTITPVFCGSAVTMEGIDMLLEGMHLLLPTAHECDIETGVDENGEEVAVLCEETKPLCAQVFKTVADPFVGKMSYIKVFSGMLTPDTVVTNMRTGETEKMSKLITLRGKKQEEAKAIPAGDIGVATKLSAQTGDTLCAGCKLTLPTAEFPVPNYTMAIKPKNKGDESKISSGMHRLVEEDRSLGYEHDYETHQQLVKGLGEQHLDVVVAKLKGKFGVDVTLEPPVVAYRETIRKKVKVQGKHKKQSGGHGQYGDVWIEFEPCDSEEMVFEEKVFGGSVPKNYFPAVEKGLRECVTKGVLAGFPVVGLKATLLDGSYHPVDSSEMAFKTAASLAYRAGLPQASPVLLEPIGSLKATVPDSVTGDLMGELNKRRGRVLGMNPSEEEEEMTVIEAEVPISEMQNFTTVLRQMTQGSGSYTLEFVRYEQLPSNLEAKVIEEAKKLEMK